MISDFTQLHRSSFNLEFETLFESMGSQSGTWLLIYGREKAKLVVEAKTALPLFSSNFLAWASCQNFC